MSIRSRLLLVLGLLLGAFGGILYLLREAESRQVEHILGAARSETRHQLLRWVGITGLPLRDFVRDFAGWRETGGDLLAPDETWEQRHLTPALHNYPVQVIWLLRADGSVARRLERDPRQMPPALPTPAELRTRSLPTDRVEFFAESPAGLWQVCGAPVPSAPGGWLLAAQLWDAGQLARLSQLSECRVQLNPISSAPPTTAEAILTLPLRDWNERPLRELRLEQDQPDLAGWIEWDGHVIRLFLAFGLLLLVALGLAVRWWVLQPLDLIGESLARQDAKPIAPLLQRNDEFRRIAGLVETAFADQRALAREVVERRQIEAALRESEVSLRHSMVLRARLARDLHDTVIQSLYAAGLGLANVREKLSTDPFGVEERLQNCVQSLNDTIRQVRRYIGDLEPDPVADRQPFSQAVRALADTMQGLWPVQIHTQLDDAVARRFSAMTELHLLQILRECISNAVRHGAATRIDILLTADGAEGVLEIKDNGSGFDPEQRTGTGRGLGNLTSRATEMEAAFRLDAAPRRGTGITMRIPLRQPPAP